MANFCPECGTKLEEKFKFCAECGEKIPETKSIKQPKKTAPPEPQTAPKEITDTPTAKKKITLPKFSVHIPKKTAMILLAIIGVVIIIGASIAIISPFDITGTLVNSKRTITVLIENTLEKDVTGCYLTVNKFQYDGIGTFFVQAGQTITLTINEENLMPLLKGSSYEIGLYATADYSITASASGVTNKVTFKIEEIAGDYFVNVVESL